MAGRGRRAEDHNNPVDTAKISKLSWPLNPPNCHPYPCQFRGSSLSELAREPQSIPVPALSWAHGVPAADACPSGFAIIAWDADGGENNGMRMGMTDGGGGGKAGG